MAIVKPESAVTPPKDAFLEIFDKYILRDGATELRKWLLESDFFTAPASTRFHGSHAGGLVAHSINVWKQMVRLLKAYPEIKTNGETVAITALLHDVCKVDLYNVDFRNAKNEAGVWEKVPYYAYDEKFAYGNHGGKSVFLINKFLRLSDGEAVAIQCHMGNEDGKYTTSRSYEQYPLAWLLHVADEAATFIDEKESK